MVSRSFTIGGVLLGMGFGGFVDGIVLHQILQWHHLVCITDHCQPVSIEHLKRQNRQDGFFHLGVLILSIIGSFQVFRATNQSGRPIGARAFWGAVLCGWGVFNFAEGLINHQILQIHHVLPDSPNELLADLAFLASGILLFLLGGWMLRSESSDKPTPRSVVS
ncbi:MAG TPA: DUF2243 domain-containing protein [Tepidisphaeraceae bacterium]